MVLARDLLTPKGTLLLAAGHVFDARLVRQIREFAGREGVRLALYIRLPDEDAGPVRARLAAAPSAPTAPNAPTAPTVPQGASHG
jgi:hypothetical protein